jgi:hypothetical protein
MFWLKKVIYFMDPEFGLCIEDEELKEFGTDLAKSAGVVKK